MSKADGGGMESEELLRNIPGNAPIETKGLVQRLWYMLANDGYGTRTAQRADLIEVSIVPNADEPARREARVVLEMVVTEDMLDGVGKMHRACIIHLVDICTTLPIAAISLANNGVGSAGVSQNIHVIYHAPASPGDKLRLINTSMMNGAHAWIARIEIWDATHRRLVASATQIKMEPSSSKL